jgi:hypothetical protein
MCIKNIINWFKVNDNDDDDPIVDQPTNPSGTKFALLVGINKYADPSANLSGSINDVNNIRSFLINKAGFEADNIRVLTDFRATKDNIIDRLHWLVYNRSDNDELVFYYSGHGSQVRDRNGDELNDYMDEILCPNDLDWNDPLTDDIVGEILDLCNDNAFLTVIIDACHSGTMTRELNSPNRKINRISKFITPPYDIRARSMDVVLHENVKLVAGSIGAIQRHILLSGCRDNQTSAAAIIDRKWQGAMTHALVKALNENPYRNWFEIRDDVLETIKNNTNYDFDQEPQLSGANELAVRNAFGLK